MKKSMSLPKKHFNARFLLHDPLDARNWSPPVLLRLLVGRDEREDQRGDNSTPRGRGVPDAGPHCAIERVVRDEGKR
jgi:hypothetical protein